MIINKSYLNSINYLNGFVPYWIQILKYILNFKILMIYDTYCASLRSSNYLKENRMLGIETLFKKIKT